MGRKKPVKHTVHTRHPRYTTPQYPRGSRKSKIQIRTVKELDEIEKTLELKNKRKCRQYLARGMEDFGYKAIAKEIRAGRNVRGNVIMAVNMVHDTVGARYDPTKDIFSPQTKENKTRERKLHDIVNKLLVGAGEKPMDSKAMFKKYAQKDREFREQVKNRNR